MDPSYVDPFIELARLATERPERKMAAIQTRFDPILRAELDNNRGCY